jgi:HAD superfamily hydrolase (TIGR01490 family)
MRKKIYRGAYKEIARHKRNGNLVVFITASIKILVEPLGDFLGADEIFALKPIFDNFTLTTKAEKPYSYEEGKLILAQQYAEEKGIDLKDCFFYSDSISDLALMEKVGYPVPTNPDPSLLVTALLRNYRVLWCNSVLPPGFKPGF